MARQRVSLEIEDKSTTHGEFEEKRKKREEDAFMNSFMH